MLHVNSEIETDVRESFIHRIDGSVENSLLVHSAQNAADQVLLRHSAMKENTKPHLLTV